MPAPQRILVNTRVLRAPLTGTQRYTRELLAVWRNDADTIAPNTHARGMLGHCWEQLILPWKVHKRLLFSPCNTGPLSVKNQVVTIHDMSVFDCPENFSPRFAAWYQFLLPKLAHRVRQIVTVSEFIRERVLFHTRVDPRKVMVIANGVSPEFHPQAIAGWQAAASAIGLPSRRYVLVVGSLEPRKNLTRIFRAWALIQARVPEDLWLVVVGTRGSPRVFGRTEINNLPSRVFFAGRVDDAVLAALYAGALIFVYVSLYEGFGLPLLEAMASGVPVVAGNRSSLPELVRQAGVLVDPANEHDIAEAVQTLVDNPSLRQDLRCRGLLRAKQHSWEQTARTTWQVLQATANGG